ncbi:MAG: DUF1573 domain-containing protein [Bacteroidales bacterium]|nr:DUF1573 domain-containing protein [Bacteroidales bacterium]
MSKKSAILAFILSLLCLQLSAKDFGGIARFDKTLHDFGTISIKDGPCSCTFTLTNIGDEDTAIYTVTTTCGCTKTEWTKPVIKPGESGTIKVTFTNDEGPYPFDKTVAAYIKGYGKPIVLHIKGNVRNKTK